MKIYTHKLSTLLRALFILFIIGSIYSCIDEDLENIGDINSTPTTEVGDESIVTFSIKVPSNRSPQASRATTYALSENDENEIEQIAVLLFDNSGYTYQPIYVSSNRIVSAGSIKSFTIKVPVGSYEMVVLANANKSLKGALKTISAGQSKVDVLKKIIVTSQGKWNATPTSSNYISIPMWGESSNVEVVKGAATNVAFTLVRMLAKIDVVLTTPIVKEKFDLQSVRLYNYYNKGYVVPYAINWSGTPPSITAPSVPNDAIKPTDPATHPILYDAGAITKETTRGVSCLNEIYTFEAPTGSATTHPTNTCIVIGGKYKNESKATYYRIDFANMAVADVGYTSTYLPLLRNHHYKINIEDITSSGLTSAEQAFSASAMNVKTSIEDWDNTTPVDVVYDGQHMLAVSQGEFTFSREERTTSSNDNTISITTNVSSGWKIDKIVSDDGTSITWLDLTSKSSRAVTSNAQFVFSENKTGSSRTAFVHIKAERLTYIVKVVQLSTAGGILITDMSGNPIDILTFKSSSGVQPASQQFKLSWPDGVAVSFLKTSTANPFVFKSGAGLDQISTSGTLSSNLNPKTYTIQPPAISAEDLASDPNYERSSTIIYSIANGSSVITKTLVLRQQIN